MLIIFLFKDKNIVVLQMQYKCFNLSLNLQSQSFSDISFKMTSTGLDVTSHCLDDTNLHDLHGLIPFQLIKLI